MVYQWQMETIQNKSDAVADISKPVANGAPKLLFDVREAALRLSVSVVSIRKLIRQNRLRRVPDFRKILISEAELQRFATCE
jgi:excisionase family DNA binding protein